MKKLNECYTVTDTQQVAAIVLMEDEMIHTDDHPFCHDATCPCHHDTRYVYGNVGRLLVEGQITEDEATAMFSGQLMSGADDTGCIVDYPMNPTPQPEHEDRQDYL